LDANSYNHRHQKCSCGLWRESETGNYAELNERKLYDLKNIVAFLWEWKIFSEKIAAFVVALSKY